MWKLNDATGKFEELTAFTKLMEGTTNEYIWRMGEHNGKLYVATMDAAIGYGYMTQLTNGSFLKMSPEEKASKIAYLANAIKLLAQEKGSEKIDEVREKLALLKALLEQYTETTQVDEETVETVIDIYGMTQAIKAFVTAMLSAQADEKMAQASDVLVNMLTNMQETVAGIAERVDAKGLEMYAYINRAVRTNKWGFDLLRTSDGGQTFEVITRTGFGDKYNYGCPSFLSTEEGLYFGTCNPFYGGQLFLLTENPDIATGIAEAKGHQAAGTTTGYYTLSGQAVEGTPARPGLYIKDGRKVVKH